MRLLRIFNNIKASDVAKSLDISKSYLSEIEHGKKVPTIEIIDKMANLLNVRTSTIFIYEEALNDEGLENNSEFFIPKAAQKWLQVLEKVECKDSKNNLTKK